MATGVIILPLDIAIPASGGSGNDPAAKSVVDSSAGSGSNKPTVSQTVWSFDAATDEHLMWPALILPPNIVGGGTLRYKFRMASAITGAIVAKAGRASTEDGVTYDSALVFTTPVTGTVLVPSTLGWTAEGTLAIGFSVIGQKQIIFFGRDADNGADTAAGDMILVAASYEYTAG